MPLVYKVRDTDIVDSKQEHEQALVNNIAIFMDSLQSKLSYETKIVSSITLADGTVQKGAVQKIRSGSYANGQPKYKNVVNKFLVTDIFLTIPGQSRKKLTRLVIAPNNIINYNPSLTDLANFDSNIKALLSHNTIPAPTVTTPTTSSPTTPTAPTDTAPPVSVTPQQPVKPGANATTLTEWYQAQGQTLPSVGSRAILYQELGQGNATMYTGTAEQNNKLLTALKAGVQTTTKATPVDTGWRFYSFSVNGDEYIEVLPWAGNIPFGYTPITKEEYLTKKQNMLTKDPNRWQPFFNQMLDKENKALTGANSGYTLVNGVPWLTADLNQQELYEAQWRAGKLKKVPIGNGFGYIQA